MRRYRDDLRPHAEHGNDDAVVMLTLCDALLDSADMLEGVTNDDHRKRITSAIVRFYRKAGVR